MVTMTLYARQQKRHRCKEQTFALCGRRRHVMITLCEYLQVNLHSSNPFLNGYIVVVIWIYYTLFSPLVLIRFNFFPVLSNDLRE